MTTSLRFLRILGVRSTPSSPGRSSRGLRPAESATALLRRLFPPRIRVHNAVRVARYFIAGIGFRRHDEISVAYKVCCSISKYLYFPAQHDGPIKTLLLDANVTQHLDTIAQRGSSYQNDVVQNRMADMVGRLDDDVMVMPGLGAAESVIRRGVEPREASNYHRRGANAMRLLVDDRAALHAWLKGDDAQPDLSAVGGDQYGTQVSEADFRIIRDDFIMPSYAALLKAYQLYLEKGSPVNSFKDLEAFAEELFLRGSRELLLGSLLLTGNSTGREMALNIMKLHEEKDLESTLKALWNTSFDLTYSRVATMPSLPELRNVIAQPAVFVTDDKHLGKLLTIIEPAAAIAHPRGGGMTADHVAVDPYIRKDLLDDVITIVTRSGHKALRDRTDIQLLQKIRRYKALKYVQQLEGWFACRYQA